MTDIGRLDVTHDQILVLMTAVDFSASSGLAEKLECYINFRRAIQRISMAEAADLSDKLQKIHAALCTDCNFQNVPK